MKFMRSFLRRHFEGKPLVALQNVGCRLRLACHVRDNYFNSLPDHCDPLLVTAPSIGRGISSLLGCCNGDNPRTEFSVAALKEHRSTIFNDTSLNLQKFLKAFLRENI